MNFYSLFYCRAYDWYNTNAQKSKETLRGSAIVLLSVCPLINVLSIISFVGIIDKHTPGNKYLIAGLGILSMIFNWFLIPMERSDLLRAEYLKLSDFQRNRVSWYFFAYLILTAIAIIAAFITVAYVKKKYGNYDL